MYANVIFGEKFSTSPCFRDFVDFNLATGDERCRFTSLARNLDQFEKLPKSNGQAGYGDDFVSFGNHGYDQKYSISEESVVYSRKMAGERLPV
jgi:hypothetical protein